MRGGRINPTPTRVNKDDAEKIVGVRFIEPGELIVKEGNDEF
jgi:hypothetical protein